MTGKELRYTELVPQRKRAVALVDQGGSANVSRQVLLSPLSVAAIADRYRPFRLPTGRLERSFF